MNNARIRFHAAARLLRPGGIFTLVWGAVTIWAGARLILHPHGRYAGWPLHIVLTAAFLWYLWRSKSPDPVTLQFPPILRGVGRLPVVLGFLVIAMLLMPTLLSALLMRVGSAAFDVSFMRAHARYVSTWIILLVALTAIAWAIVLMWRGRVSRRLLRLGLGAGCLAALGQGFRAARTGAASDVFWTALQLLTVPILFIAGGLLMDHTGVGRVRLLDGRWKLAVRGFLSGVALCIPFGLLNTLYGAHGGLRWTGHWWDVAAYAWFPATAEETWARLFLIPYMIALLAPAPAGRTGRAIIAAVTLSALAHGLVHAPTVGIFGPQGRILSQWVAVTVFETGLLFLLPMAVLFVKRDWEHAVGFHYAVNLIPMLVRLL